MHTEIKGDKLVLTIDLKVLPVQSKSALAKALEKGLSAASVPANLIYTSGGFTRIGEHKVSINVMKA